MSKIVGVSAGLLAALAVFLAAEWTFWALYPSAIETEDPTIAAQVIVNTPLTGQMLLVGGFLFGAFVGAAVALRLSQWRPSGWLIAGLIAVGGIASAIMVPHPLWMQIASVAAPFVGGWLAERIFHRARPGDPLIG